jgi:hypothetical protein
MLGAQAVQPAVAEQSQPLGELAHAPAQEVGYLEPGLAAGHPEHRGEALVEALVVGLAAAALEFLALLWAEMNQLHDVPTWADAGPPKRAFAAAFGWPFGGGVRTREV